MIKINGKATIINYKIGSKIIFDINNKINYNNKILNNYNFVNILKSKKYAKIKIDDKDIYIILLNTKINKKGNLVLYAKNYDSNDSREINTQLPNNVYLNINVSISNKTIKNTRSNKRGNNSSNISNNKKKVLLQTSSATQTLRPKS